MKQDEIIATLDLRVNKLKKRYHRLTDRYDEEGIHDYRVEIKKLRAFIRMINSGEGTAQKLRIGREMKDVYRLCGHIRNLQLHHQRLGEVVQQKGLLYPEYHMNCLEEEQANSIDRLKKETRDLLFHRFAKHLTDADPADFTGIDKQHYVDHQIRLISLAIAEIASRDEALHELRKHLKDIGYNRHYLESFFQSGHPAFITDPAQTESLTEKLGHFHDLAISLSFLEPGTCYPLNELERVILQQIRSEILEVQSALKNQLEAILSTSS